MCLNRAHLPETLFHTNFKLFCVKGWNASKKERMPYIRLDKVGTKTVVQARLFQIFFFSDMHRPQTLHPLSPGFESSVLTTLFFSA